MTEEEKVKIALTAIDKGLSYEELYYSDFMYGREDKTDEVFEYVVEARDEGLTDFYKKYEKYL